MKRLIYNRNVLVITLIGLVQLSLVIDADDLPNYANQLVPNFITKDNTGDNPITDEGATLGRVLFYDKMLSSDNSTSCSSCHKQEHAFGDVELASQGVNGPTLRHTMRLVNARFSAEEKFFWDERAATLEDQTTMPIRDHLEMGYSGTMGDPDFDDLLEEMQSSDYYPALFSLAFGDAEVTEERMQLALAQFIRSIQSFDTSYDLGRSQVENDFVPFPNFTDNENAGKELFFTPPIYDVDYVRVGGGVRCEGCHEAPEFDIRPDVLSNGVVTALGMPNVIDTVNTRAPTLRNLFKMDGTLNGPMMHNGMFTDIQQVFDHYETIPQFEDQPEILAVVDPVFYLFGAEIDMNISPLERAQLIAFLRTLTGNDVYSNAKWSDPFDDEGNLCITNLPTPECEADLNGDLRVNASDLLIMLSGFGCESDCNGDIDEDGSTSIADLLILLGAFGTFC